MKTLLFTAQKNEGPFILEWVAYHRAIGFTDIVVFSNDCTDGSDLLLDELATQGLVQHIRTEPTPEQTAQYCAAGLMEEMEIFREADWVSWLDIDEYLNIQVADHTVPALVSALGDASGVIMNWRLFGDSGIPAWNGGLVIEDFTRCARPRNKNNDPVKSFYRPNEIVKEIYTHRPVFTSDIADSGQYFLDSEGGRVPTEFLTTMRPHGPPLQVLQPQNRKYRLAQVNHYAVMSFDVFSMKKFRGAGMKPIGADASERGKRYGDKFWVKRNRNEVQDTSIQRHVPALKQLRQEWLAKPKIRAAHYDCCAALAHRLVELEASGHPMTPSAAGLG